MLGSGAIIVVDDSVPIVSVALRLAEFYRHESCGKCVPCREGTNWTVKMLERIDRGEATPMDLDVMAERPGQHHRQLPLRAGRLDGDAGRLDDQALPARVRTAHRRGGPSALDASISEEAGLAVPATGEAAWMPQRRLDHVHDRRPRGARARGRVAARRGQARRRRGPVLLLRAEARRAGRRMPHVHGRDRGHPEAADVVLHARSRTGWSSTPRPTA